MSKAWTADRFKTAAKKYLFSGKEFYISLGIIALPIILQNLIGSSLNMVDTVMIGKVGEIQIAAVGIANQFFLLFNLVIIGIHAGCGVFIAQFWSKEDYYNIRKVLAIGLFTSVIVAVLFMIAAMLFSKGIIAIFNDDSLVISEGAIYLKVVCVSYVFTALSFGYGFASRSIGNAFFPMVASALGLVCNTILNYILIFGKFGVPVMGVKGAAIATVIARILEVLLMIIYIYAKKSVLAARLKDLHGITKEFIYRVFKTVIPVVLNESCWALGFVVYSIAYGHIGAKAIASVQICNTIQNLFTVAIFGVASASGVMVGHRIGADNENDGIVYAWRFTILSLIGGLVSGILLAVSAPFILSFFNVSPEVYDSALKILYINAIILVIRFLNIVLIVGILRGGGDARYAFIIEGITMWFIGVPLAFAGAYLFKWPVYVVVALITVEEVVKAALVMVRLISNKWIRNVVNEFETI